LHRQRQFTPCEVPRTPDEQRVMIDTIKYRDHCGINYRGHAEFTPLCHLVLDV
jgi:hypothetical protein